MEVSVLKLATIRITCNRQTGTALLYFPGPHLDYVYVFTAKHCLAGEDFEYDFSNEDILLDKIFNSRTESFHSYNLTLTDRILTTDNKGDLAVLILSKQKILELTGLEFNYQVIDSNDEIKNFLIRGFASMNDQKEDRSFSLSFQEEFKVNHSQILLKSHEDLDTFFEQAVDNMKGISGAGAFAKVLDNDYLVGIIHCFEEKNLFHATKITCLNNLLIKEKLKEILVIKPETSTLVIDTFKQIEKNEIQLNTGINDTIGNLNIPRNTLEIDNLLLHNGVAVIFGKPGVGKSAIAKSLVSTLKKNRNVTVISFTSEQIISVTLEEAFSKAGYKADLHSILKSPIISNRIVIWVESFEKVLESNCLEPFKELLNVCKQNSNVHVLITIRDYILQKFRINLRFELPVGKIYYQLKEFDESEMELVKVEIPEINPLLKNHKIKHILRTPYYLDKAIRILPELLESNQLDELKFKKLMWENIVEKGKNKRGVVFQSICLKRAREMTLFTTINKSQKIINELVKDSLLEKSLEEIGRYSPSHDILEDWALTRYVQQKWLTSSNAFDFLTTIENSPSMTRAFRIWLEEFYRNDSKSAIEMTHSILVDPNVVEDWREVILIATLKSNCAHILLDTLTEELLKNDGELLRKVILLLQTGCMMQSYVASSLSEFSPVGSGWDFVVRFIRINLETVLSFSRFENTYISFLKLWSKQLPEFNISELPPSAQEAGELIEDYLYRHQINFKKNLYRKSDDGNLKPLLFILFQLTSAIPEIVKELIEASVNIEINHSKWRAKGLLKNIRQYLIGGVLTDQICKYFPEKILKVASQEWRREERVVRKGSLLTQIDTFPEINDFGLPSSIEYLYDSPSGFQSFFYWLFLHHPHLAIDFLIPFLNKSFEMNKAAMIANRRELTTISISFEEETLPPKAYFGSLDHWVLFRGANSMNELIVSILMALEKSFLERATLGKENYSEIRQYLKRLILETNNVGVLGVVLSIIQAHPELLDETSVKLLGVKEFYLWDSLRYSTELLTPTYFHKDANLQQERAAEDSRLHRKKYYLGLVGFVADYMFYHQVHNYLLFKQVDGMWESLDESDSRMKKFLFDMDVRKYNYKPVDQQGFENIVHFTPGYDSQVQGMILNNEDIANFSSVPTLMWAINVFDYKELSNKTYPAWKTAYAKIRNTKDNLKLIKTNGAMAAIGLRDFGEHLTNKELDWCHQELLKYVEKLMKPSVFLDNDSFALDQKQALIGLSFVFERKHPKSIAIKIKDAIFRLLISNIDELSKIYIELGATEYLNKNQSEFVLNCWYGLLEYITYKHKIRELGVKQAPVDIRHSKEIEDHVWIDRLIKSVVHGNIKRPDSIDIQFHLSTDYLLADALRIIPKVTGIEYQRDFIQKILNFHLDFLSKGDDYSRLEFTQSRKAVKFFYSRYILVQPQEIAQKLFIELINNTYIEDGKVSEINKVKFVYEMTEEFIHAANQGNSVPNFWNLWESLRLWIIKNDRIFLMKLFFIDINWTDTTDSWPALENKSLYYKDFIHNYGHLQINSVVKFLNGIAFKNFMPESISWIKIMIINHSLARKRFKEIDFILFENFVKKAFYSYGENIKNQREILNDFLFILEFLIEEGSTVAYLLKEELVQYKKIE